MADKKVSALTDGSPAVSTDEIHIARSGADYKLSVADVWRTVTKSYTASISEITNCGTSPIAFLPAVPGYVYHIVYLTMVRTGVQYATSPTLFFGPHGSANILTNVASSQTFYGVFERSGDNLENVAFAIGTSGVDPTVDGGNPGSPVKFTMEYRLVALT